MAARRPTVLSLLARIAESALTGGMLWIVVVGSAVVLYLHLNHMQTDLLFALLICGVAATALLRGMQAWQTDRDEYRRSLIEYRMQMEEKRHRNRVRKNITWDRH